VRETPKIGNSIEPKDIRKLCEMVVMVNHRSSVMVLTSLEVHWVWVHCTENGVRN